MIELFKKTDIRLKSLFFVWNELSIEKKEALIETYWNVALIERDNLSELLKRKNDKDDNRCYGRLNYKPHLEYLYYNTYLAFNLYIKHTGDWSVLREDMKEISLLLWKFNKGQYAYSLFKHIGKDSRERKIILNGFHNSKLNMRECSVCGKMVNASNYKQHYKICYKEYAKEGNRLKNT